MPQRTRYRVVRRCVHRGLQDIRVFCRSPRHTQPNQSRMQRNHSLTEWRATAKAHPTVAPTWPSGLEFVMFVHRSYRPCDRAHALCWQLRFDVQRRQTCPARWYVTARAPFVWLRDTDDRRSHGLRVFVRLCASDGSIQKTLAGARSGTIFTPTAAATHRHRPLCIARN